MGHDADDLEAVQRAGREHIYRTSLYVLRNPTLRFYITI